MADLSVLQSQLASLRVSVDKICLRRNSPPPPPPTQVSAKAKRSVSKKPKRPAISKPPGVGTILFGMYKSWGMQGCSHCNKLRRRMDGWGIEGCRERLDEIVEDILPRAQVWWNKQGAWTRCDAFWQHNQSMMDRLSVATAGLKGIREALRAQIKIHVQHAIDNASASQADNILASAPEPGVSPEGSGVHPVAGA